MDHEYDGRRGCNHMHGWWIDEAEAKIRSKQKRRHEGDDWWKELSLQGRYVEVKQYDKTGPDDKPFWLYVNGDMYLGEWAWPHEGDINEDPDCDDDEEQHPAEQGVGITYNNIGRKGLVCISEWEDGLLHGYGKSKWMEESKIWQENYLPNSPICKKVGRKRHKFPFNYEGKYNKSYKCGTATVTLKDGTSRRGVWKYNKPVKDWWETHARVDETEEYDDSNSACTNSGESNNEDDADEDDADEDDADEDDTDEDDADEDDTDEDDTDEDDADEDYVDKNYVDEKYVDGIVISSNQRKFSANVPSTRKSRQTSLSSKMRSSKSVEHHVVVTPPRNKKRKITLKSTVQTVDIKAEDDDEVEIIEIIPKRELSTYIPSTRKSRQTSTGSKLQSSKSVDHHVITPPRKKREKIKLKSTAQNIDIKAEDDDEVEIIEIIPKRENDETSDRSMIHHRQGLATGRDTTTSTITSVSMITSSVANNSTTARSGASTFVTNYQRQGHKKRGALADIEELEKVLGENQNSNEYNLNWLQRVDNLESVTFGEKSIWSPLRTRLRLLKEEIYGIESE